MEESSFARETVGPQETSAALERHGLCLFPAEGWSTTGISSSCYCSEGGRPWTREATANTYTIIQENMVGGGHDYRIWSGSLYQLVKTRFEDIWKGAVANIRS